MASSSKIPATPSSLMQLPNEETWTHVTRKSSKGKGKENRNGRLTKVSGPEMMSPLPRSVPTLSVEEIRTKHYHLTIQWRLGWTPKRLFSLFDKKLDTHVINIDRAICLGNGSFDPPDGVQAAIRCAHVQTEAFLTIVESLEQLTGTKIDCFFQEPLYTDNDKAFLRSRGHTVVNTPHAYKMVTATTLVFGIHLYRPEYCNVLEDVYPAMLIGNDQAVYHESVNAEYMAKDPVGTTKLLKLEEVYDKFAFPTEAGDNTFSSTSIYWQSDNRGEIVSSDPTSSTDTTSSARVSL